VPRSHPHRLPDQVIRRRLRAVNPALVGLYERRVGDYDALVDDIGRRTREPSGEAPHVCGLRLPAGAQVIGQLDRRADTMAAVADAAERHAAELLAPVG
jgi:hypothetical protein